MTSRRRRPTRQETAILRVLCRAGKALRRDEITVRLKSDQLVDARTMIDCRERGWVIGDDSTGWWPTHPGRDAAYDRPTVLLTTFDLMQVLHGNAMTVATEDGGEAIVRLYGTDEYIAHRHALVDETPEVGGTKISRQQAEQLTTPWNQRNPLDPRGGV